MTWVLWVQLTVTTLCFVPGQRCPKPFISTSPMHGRTYATEQACREALPDVQRQFETYRDYSDALKVWADDGPHEMSHITPVKQHTYTLWCAPKGAK